MPRPNRVPASRWNGITADRTEQNRTEVDLEALGDMVEGMCRRLREMNERGELLAALRVNIGDLLGRCALGTSRTDRPS